MARMKLITKEVEKQLKKYPLYSQDGKGENAICSVKFFHPATGWTWYVTEADLETGELFGVVCGIEMEMGYFSLQELQSICKWTLYTERDRYFDPTPIKDIKDNRLQEWVKQMYGNK